MFYTAINECDPANRKDDCEQICVDTPDKWTCECPDGYKLHDNGKNCTGKCTLHLIQTKHPFFKRVSELSNTKRLQIYFWKTCLATYLLICLPVGLCDNRVLAFVYTVGDTVKRCSFVICFVIPFHNELPSPLTQYIARPLCHILIAVLHVNPTTTFICIYSPALPSLHVFLFQCPSCTGVSLTYPI